MDIDILTALSDTPRPVGNLRCRIGRWLDDIPEDAPGKDRLVATLEERDQESLDWRRLDQLDALLIQLGLKSSMKSIGDHRGRRCRCWH